MTESLSHDWHTHAQQARALRPVPDPTPSVAPDLEAVSAVLDPAGALPPGPVSTPLEMRLAADVVALTRVLLGVGVPHPEQAVETVGAPTLTVVDQAPEPTVLAPVEAVLEPVDLLPAPAPLDLPPLPPVAVFTPISLPEVAPLVPVALGVELEDSHEPPAVTPPALAPSANVLAEVAFLDL